MTPSILHIAHTIQGKPRPRATSPRDGNTRLGNNATAAPSAAPGGRSHNYHYHCYLVTLTCGLCTVYRTCCQHTPPSPSFLCRRHNQTRLDSCHYTKLGPLPIDKHMLPPITNLSPPVETVHWL
ncbi:hypothetical protein J6590_093700 [Homalodisca vitripennis]|nr:hypothetical protein J6590_093700 [Homalodisca vitripennis]